MIIENEQLQFAHFELSPSGQSFTLRFDQRSFSLSHLQGSYLQVMQKELSIAATFRFFFAQGWLMNCSQFFELVRFLVQHHLIMNPGFTDYFNRIDRNIEFSTPSYFSQATLSEHASSTQNGSTNSKKKTIDLKSFSFFRSLAPEVVELFENNLSFHKLAPGTIITRRDDTNRDLFVLVKGTCSIYRPQSQGAKNQWVAQITGGSCFGEGSFFLNQPRSADVIADTPIEIVRIRHSAVFDNLIKEDKARALQIRFWVLHAFQRSELLKNLPSDCIDSLLMTGRVVKAQAGQFLFQQADHAQSFFVVIQGKLQIIQNGKLIRTQEQGDCLGEIGLMLNNGRRSAAAQVLNESLLLEIQAQDFYKLLSQNLYLAKVLEQLAQERLLADRSRS